MPHGKSWDAVAPAAIRSDKEIWSVVAEAPVIVEIPRLEGDVVDLSMVDGVRELTVDGEKTIRPLPALGRTDSGVSAGRA